MSEEIAEILAQPINCPEPENTPINKTFHELLAVNTSTRKFSQKQLKRVRDICFDAGVKFDQGSALHVFQTLDVSDLFNIQNSLQVQFLIVCQSIVRGCEKNYLIFDGRFADAADVSWATSTQKRPADKNQKTTKEKRQKMCCCFDAEGKILIQSETEKDLPSLSRTKKTSSKYYTTFTLYRDANQSTRKVKTREDALEWLGKEENRWKKIWLDLCVQDNPKTHKVIPWIICYNKKSDEYWEAFTTRFYNLSFRKKKPLKFIAKKIQKKKVEMIANQTSCTGLTEPERSSSGPKMVSEKSSPVIVNLEGLTLAYHLGLIDTTELENASIRLGLTCASLWIHYEISDSGDLNARHIAYKDQDVAKNFRLSAVKSKKRKSQSDRSDLDSSTSVYEKEWQDVFSFMWQRRKILLESRAAALKSIVEKIKNIPDVCRRGQYAQCKEKIIKDNLRMTVLVHTSSDQFFHSIKNHMAHFFHEKEKNYLKELDVEFRPKKNNSKFKGVQLITCGENNIIGLATPWMSIMNQHAIFDSMSCDFNIHKDHVNLCAALKDWTEAGQDLEPEPEFIDDGRQVDLWKINNKQKSWTLGKMLSIFKSSGNLVIELQTDYLPPVIEQDTNWQTSTHIYSAGRVYNPDRLPKLLSTYVDRRGQMLCAATLNLWITFSRWFMLTFHMDINFSPSMHVSNLMFKAVWLTYSHDSGPLGQAPEKLKNIYERLIRDHCHGGFSYSSESEIKCGEILETTDVDKRNEHGKRNEQVQTIAEYDISSCYGYSASSASMATAFCYGFVKEHDPEVDALAMVEKTLKHNSYEYRAVYFKLFSVMREPGYPSNPIRSVYSNFHFFGQLRIGPFPVDLAIVRQNGQVEMHNMDSLFTHGCYSFRCKPEMEKFVNGQLRSDLESKALSRDCMIKKWIDGANSLFGRTTNGSTKFSYSVISSCHHNDFSPAQLRHAFNQNISLREIVEPYNQLEVLNSKKLTREKFNNLEFIPSGITFLLSCDITTNAKIGENKTAASRPLFVWTTRDGDNNNQVQCFEKNSKAKNFLATKDTFKFLSGYEISDIQFCLFFRQCKVLPMVFKKLLSLRSPHKPCVNMFAKNLINTTCGFFGFNREKREMTKESVWVTTRLNSNVPLPQFKSAREEQPHDSKKKSKPNIHVCISGCVANSVYFTVRKNFPKDKNKLNNATTKLLTTPLANFALIIEYGKNLLSSYLGRFENDLIPGTWKLVYSNVDNIVVALTRPSLSAALKPEIQNEEWTTMYDGHCKSFIHCSSPFPPCSKYFPPGEENLCKPGKLSLQWAFTREDNWSFASPKLQFYAIKCETDGGKTVACKTPGLNNLSSIACYDLALCMLRSKGKLKPTCTLSTSTAIVQERRTDKLNGTEKKTMTLVFK
jgi:hypothetical protein